jgi:tetratricopeptide (TPR) repeat protein
MKLSARLALFLALAAAGCNPKDAKSPLQQAEAFIAKNELDQAVTVLEEARASGVQNPKVDVRLAEIYTVKGNASRAVTLYKETIAQHPELGVVHVPLGHIYLDLKEYALAKAEFEKARAQGVGDDKVALPAGICAGQLGDIDAAEREFERALAAGIPEETVRYNQAVCCEGKADFKKAQELFEGILAKNPHSATAKRELAHVLLVVNPPDAATVKRAMDLLWDVKDELKDDPRVYEFMGDGWLLLGDFDASLDAYTEALRLGKNPKSVEDKYVLAKQRQKAAAAEKAAKDKDKAAAGKPK